MAKKNSGDGRRSKRPSGAARSRSENHGKSRTASAVVDLSAVGMEIFATEEFVANQLTNNGEALVSFINAQPSEFMAKFVVQYDKLPDAMCGKLFACGVNPAVFPRDMQLSTAFIRVAASINPRKLVELVLNRLDIQSVRLALRNFSDEFIENLWGCGMPVSKIPLARASDGIFKSLAVSDKKRLSMETKAQVNDDIRHLVELALHRRSAATAFHKTAKNHSQENSKVAGEIKPNSL
jgi:hypothetical protein